MSSSQRAGGSAGNLYGSKLREIRKARGFTLEEAAARMEFDLEPRYAVAVSFSHLGKIERGEKPLTDRTIKALSLVYDVEVYEIFRKEK